MNKILIVGHPTTGYRNVERLLNECGMSPAITSRREKLSPIEIGASILKSRGFPLLADNFRQIEAGPVWQGLALDLMLGNMEQPLWGWADPNAIQLLEYWKALDPSIVFVLVYDNSTTLLTRANPHLGDLSPAALQRLVNDWCEYNGELLSFYHRNADRSLLVHAEQVQLSANLYLQQVRTRLGAPLNTVLGDSAAEVDRELPAPTPPVRISHSVTTGSVATPSTELRSYLAAAVLNALPQVAELYEELQSVATLPLADTGATELAPLGAWNAAVQADARLSDLQRSSKLVGDELVAVQTEHKELRSRFESLLPAEQLAADRLVEIRALEEELSSQAQRANTTATQLVKVQERLASCEKEAEDESEMLVTHLHQVQEALEQRYIENGKLSELANSLKPYQKQAEEQLVQIKKLNQKLAAMDDLVNQHTQELKQRDCKVAELQKLAQVKVDREAEFQRISKELTVLRQRNVEQDKKIKELVTTDTPEKRNHGDAEPKGQEHREIVDENALLLMQLHKVQAELERYFLENEELKATATKLSVAPAKPEYFGAAERIKQQLTYRLGIIMIDHSRSIRGWISMAWALRRETRQFRAERAATPTEKLPPVRLYKDAHEAERVKRHLAYRLGEKFLANARSPIGWLRIPFVLRGAVISFKQERATQS